MPDALMFDEMMQKLHESLHTIYYGTSDWIPQTDETGQRIYFIIQGDPDFIVCHTDLLPDLKARLEEVGFTLKHIREAAHHPRPLVTDNSIFVIA